LSRIKKNVALNIPNIITYVRILVIPTIVILFYIDGLLARWAIAILFFIASVSDFLDGYIARKFQQYSDLGKLLDPIADKLLVAAILILLVAVDSLKDYTLIPAIIILSREILVSGLREFLANQNVSMPVSMLAKWKTTLQLMALEGFLLSYAAPKCPWLAGLSAGILWIAAILTVMSGYVYMRQGVKHLD
jgi:CDP-diacylglycerol---glycerol-3-phosphate 3-phosphatidyltransferase